MKTSRSIALAAFLTMTAGCTASAFNLDDAARMTSAVTGTPTTNVGVLGNSQTATLINTLVALNVTPLQALGGTGALLGLAKNQLQETAYAQLAQSVPGLESLTGSNALNQASVLGSLLGQSPGMTQASELLANVNSMNDVNQTFSALGMQPTMVGQFTPVLLQYLGNQGASGPLLQSLEGVWGVSGTLANPALPGAATGAETGTATGL